MADKNLDIKLRVSGIEGIRQANAEARALAGQARKTEEAVSGIGSKLAAGLGGAGLLAALGAAGESALSAYQDVDRALAGLEVSARKAQVPFDDLRQKVVDASQDGVLSVQQLSQNFQVLLDKGLDVDKALQLQNSAKALAAFKGVTGNIGNDVAGFFKALSNGEVELASNLDPTLKAVISRLGGMEKIAQDNTLAFKLFDEVIARGSALMGDFEKRLAGSAGQQARLTNTFTEFKAAIGASLEEAAAQGFGSIADFLKTITAAFKDLPAQTQKVVVGITALGAVLLGIVPVAVAFWAAITGPVGIAVAAVLALTAGAVGLAVALSDSKATVFAKELEEVSDRLDKLKEGTEAYNRALADQKAKLAQLPAAYRDIAEEVATLNDGLARRNRLEEIYRAAQATGKAADRIRNMTPAQRAALRQQIVAQQEFALQGKPNDANVRIPAEILPELANPEPDVFRRDATAGTIRAALQSLLTTLDSVERSPKPSVASGSGSVGPAKGPAQLTDFLLSEYERASVALARESAEFQKAVKERLAAGKLSAKEAEELNSAAARKERELRAELLRSTVDGFIGASDSLSATISKNTADQKAVEDALASARRDGTITAIEEEKELLRVRIAGTEKQAAALVAAGERLSQQVLALQTAETGAARAAAGGALAGSGGEALKTLGGAGVFGKETAGTITGIGAGFAVAGLAVGAVAGIIGAIDAAQERQAEIERRREEEAERRRQKAYENEMRRLASVEAAQKLAFDISNRLVALEKTRRDLQVQLAELEATSASEALRIRRAEARRILRGAAGGAATSTSFDAFGADEIVGNSITTYGPGGATTIEGSSGGFRGGEAIFEGATGFGVSSSAFGLVTTATRAEAEALAAGLADLGKLDPSAQVNVLSNVAKAKESERGARQKLAQIISDIANKSAGGWARLKAFLLSPDAFFLTSSEFSALGDAYVRRGEGNGDAARRAAAAVAVSNSAAIDAAGAAIDRAGQAQMAAVQNATLSEQLKTQPFADELARIQTNAETAAATGTAYDRATELRDLASRIASELGLSDLTAITAKTGEQFGTSGADAENFRTLIGILSQIRDADEETARNTASLVETRREDFVDLARGLAVGRAGILSQVGLGGMSPKSSASAVALAIGARTTESDSSAALEIMRRQLSVQDQSLSELRGLRSDLSKAGGPSSEKYIRRVVSDVLNEKYKREIRR